MASQMTPESNTTSIASPELKTENNVDQKGTTTPTKSDKGEAASEDSPPKSQGLIKARGTYYPLTAFPTSMPQGAVMRKDEDESSPNKSDTSSSAPLSNSGKLDQQCIHGAKIPSDVHLRTYFYGRRFDRKKRALKRTSYGSTVATCHRPHNEYSIARSN